MKKAQQDLLFEFLDRNGHTQPNRIIIARKDGMRWYAAQELRHAGYLTLKHTGGANDHFYAINDAGEELINTLAERVSLTTSEWELLDSLYPNKELRIEAHSTRMESVPALEERELINAEVMAETTITRLRLTPFGRRVLMDHPRVAKVETAPKMPPLIEPMRHVRCSVSEFVAIESDPNASGVYVGFRYDNGKIFLGIEREAQEAEIQLYPGELERLKRAIELIEHIRRNAFTASTN